MSIDHDALALTVHMNGSGITVRQARGIAEAVHAAGYRRTRIIHTADELDALPSDTTIRGEQGGIWYREVPGPGAAWRKPGTNRKHWGSDVNLPATVLWEPADG